MAIPTPQVRCRAQSQPDSVIANIVAHYGIGTACYANQLADSLDPDRRGFRFFPDIQDSLGRPPLPDLPSVYDQWNKAVETSVTQTISATYDTVRVYFDSEYAGRVTSTNPARETRFYNYRVLVATGAVDSTYQGQAELTMVQVTSDWYLETFRDHRDTSGLPTWGSLRADHRTGL